MKHSEAPLLLIKDVGKWYEIPLGFWRKEKIRAVDGVYLEIRRGGVHAIVGESGSGKSTLARVIVGLEEPDTGSIQFDDIDLSQMRKDQKVRKRFRREVQMVFQNPYSSLNPRKRVRSTLSKPFKIHGKPFTNDTLKSLLSRVDLLPPSAFLDKFPHQLSGGQRQRISIARALALDPKLVVLDEPTSALDVTTKTQILDLLKRLQMEGDLTLIFITHELPFLRLLSNHISVMYNGKIVEEGRAGDIFDNAYHPYTIGLLNSILEIDPHKARKKRIFSIEGETPSSINPPSGCRFHPRCPIVQESCREEPPPMLSISEGHKVACPVSASRTQKETSERWTIYQS